MSQIEVSPGGVGFIRTPTIAVPGVPSSAKRRQWVTDRTRATSTGSDSVATARRRAFGATD